MAEREAHAEIRNDETDSQDDSLEVEISPEPEAEARLPRHQWGLIPRIACGLIAGGLVIASAWMPIWSTKLKAPQYPRGLTMTVYGTYATGDIFEVDTLNHYVGMKPFRFADAAEAKLWLPSLAAAILAVIVATLFGRRWLGRLARLYLWLLPVGVMADIQYRLYLYGHQLDHDAAFRLKPFTPLVIGKTKVLNFSATSMPGGQLLSIFAAAAVLSFGPKLIEMASDRLAIARASTAESEADDAAELADSDEP